MGRTIYLDHMASTPLDPRVVEVMRPWFEADHGLNPHSRHRAGWRAAAAVEGALAEVAALIGARPGEIVLTSGATEANNLALFGASQPGRAVMVSAVEHPSVLETRPALDVAGRHTRVLPVDPEGRVDPEALGPLAPGDLVSIMAANNEVGALQPLVEIASACRAAGALIHTDAVQFLSTLALDVRALGIDLLSLSGHKLYAPQGIGALYVRDGIDLTPLLFGGGQQGGLRPGTVPTALVAGLGEACRLARLERDQDRVRVAGLRTRLLAGLRELVAEVEVNGPETVAGDDTSSRPGRGDCLSGCLNVTFKGVDAEDLLLDLPELCLSTGSACSSARPGPSHVLLAMGRSLDQAHGSIRFGLGRFTSAGEIDLALTRLGDVLARPGAHGGS